MSNLNASKTLSVPSHMYRQRRDVELGRNVSAYVVRTAELSAVGRDDEVVVAGQLLDVRRVGAELHSTPSSRQRSCRISSSRLRLIAAKPCPPLVMTSPRKWTSMSSQRANSRSICAWIAGSACSMPPSVSSEKTTPKPNVSSAALRSQTVISWSGPSCLASAAKYSPPGPPPITAIRTCHSDLVVHEYIVFLTHVVKAI